ncbi:alanine/glycine:cation symporter family protein [Bacillus swezeyi]|uniref:alanine/glycine:cation symporter family protein n=1 Tax=Bacillus swezeyi TaxID=1925020 RepID=UPI002E1E9F75|nr:alanine/glycine:cation symporter family protein [Bacillus swezeyi]MED2976961.1 alanine/glycine:cation symporter family protein [Bacillus swezeyi]
MIQNVVDSLNSYIWSPALVFFFLIIGIFYTVATRFLQIRHLKDMVVLTFKGKDSEAGLSPFKALSMSLGSRVGTGTIAGVATAIAFGGPGAVFWIWMMGLLGAVSSFIEITLTQVYKSKIRGEYRGGVPFYIEKGLKMRKTANLFAFVTIIVMAVLWPTLQANTIAVSVHQAFGISTAFTGGILAIILAIIIFGGVKRLGRVAETVVPTMAIIYVLICLVIVGFNLVHLPGVIMLILKSAFGADSVLGGVVGSAITWGVQRGAFSHAAGIGSETFEAGAAEVSHPAKQGLVQAFSVYLTTLVICSATAFTILITGMYNVSPDGGAFITSNAAAGEDPSVYTQLAVESVIPGFGTAFLAIALFFFGFTTLMSYYYKAETCLAFINRNREKSFEWILHMLKLILLVTVFYGSVQSGKIVWALGDLGMGSMAWLNLIAILFMTKTALKVLRDYEEQKKEGKDPVFDPKKLGIKDADFWEKDYQSMVKEDETNTVKQVHVRM